jgi:argininosuccinate lyase
MMATDLADYLVRKGATFRESHHAVGSLVRQAEEQGCELTDLPQRAFTQAHALFADDVYDALGARASLGHREVVGGTGPEAVAEQLDSARKCLLPVAPEKRGSVNDLRWIA